jgi:proteasome lid subunit RPN8/RPN11
LARFYISSTVLERTRECFEKWGEYSLEFIVLWGGYRTSEGDYIVTTCYIPEQHSSPILSRVTEKAMGDLLAKLYSMGQILIAQLHTHPPGISHPSRIDEEGLAVHYEGFIYIIVPNYGLADWDLTDCSIYEYKEGCLKPLSQEEIRNRFITLSHMVEVGS